MGIEAGRPGGTREKAGETENDRADRGGVDQAAVGPIRRGAGSRVRGDGPYPCEAVGGGVPVQDPRRHRRGEDPRDLRRRGVGGIGRGFPSPAGAFGPGRGDPRGGRAGVVPVPLAGRDQVPVGDAPAGAGGGARQPPRDAGRIRTEGARPSRREVPRPLRTGGPGEGGEGVLPLVRRSGLGKDPAARRGSERNRSRRGGGGAGGLDVVPALQGVTP